VDAAVASVLPGDDGAAGPVRHDLRLSLIAHPRAQRMAVDWPRGIHSPRGQDVVGVDVVIAAQTPVVPRDDGAAGPVRRYLRETLAADRRADCHAVRSPLHHAGGV